MGIPTDPGYELYESDDCNCWPVGSTPKKLWVNFSGIIQGDLWTPGNPPPPNKIFIVEYASACTWINEGVTYQIYFTIQPAFSAVQIFVVDVDFAFDSNFAGVCAGNYTNRLTGSGQIYGGGKATILQREAV